MKQPAANNKTKNPLFLIITNFIALFIIMGLIIFIFVSKSPSEKSDIPSSVIIHTDKVNINANDNTNQNTVPNSKIINNDSQENQNSNSGLRGVLPTELLNHNTPDNCWIVYYEEPDGDGIVYDITRWNYKGQTDLTTVCGQDATEYLKKDGQKPPDEPHHEIGIYIVSF